MHAQPDTPVALSIAGSDSGGGAGIQADLLTFSANGVFGTTAITCLTAQNPDGVSAIEALPPAFVREQVEQVRRYFRIGAVKTGMLFNAEIVREVAAFLEANPDLPAVVDPVMVATSGAVLLHESAIEAVTSELLPRARLITPNLDEAGVLLGHRPESPEEMESAARELARRHGVAVLLKGGHLSAEEALTDILCLPGGEIRRFTGERIEETHTHGSGCTLSSAIAARLARGRELTEAVGEALTYLRRGMRHPLFLSGRACIRH